MRDLIYKLDQVVKEANLSASQVTKYPDRFAAFIDHIRNQRPFITADGTEVVLDPAEADRFSALQQTGQFRGIIQGRDLQGQSWPISSFLKTSEFGGAAAKPGDTDTQALKKESLLVKPSQIGIADRNIPASELGQQIINNSVLQSTDYGRAVIQMAQNIASGEPARVPEEFAKNDSVKKAITDYASEYLGVLALVTGQSRWIGGQSKADQFMSWLGGDLDSLVLYFPSASNSPIADSFATVSSTDSEKKVYISSKGTGGGAAPSLSKLQIPDHVRDNPDFADAVAVIDLTQRQDLPNPKTVSQVFAMMNLLNETVPEKIPAQFREYLPWPTNITQEVMQSVKTQAAMPKYAPLIQSLRSKGSDGGKLAYVTKNAVLDIVNSGAVPKFQEVILETLDYNFIQQYSKMSGNTLDFSTQWPAKLDGRVTMESKTGGSDPTKGGFSFKLRPAGDRGGEAEPYVSDASDTAAVSPDPAADAGQARSDITAASPRLGTEKELGRRRRQRSV